MRRLVLALLCFFMLTPSLLAEVDTAWVRRYDGPVNGGDHPSAMAIDSAGNIYVTGSSYRGEETEVDYTTIKYYPDGETAWVRSYNGSTNLYDFPWAMAVDSSGNVYVTGETNFNFGIAPERDYCTIKYYPNGDTAWVRRYNGMGNSIDIAHAIDIDRFGNVYVAGGSTGDTIYYDFATIKYYPDGETAWVRVYNGPDNHNDEATAITADEDGNVYVAGYSKRSDTFRDYVTIKYYPNGDTAWIRRLNLSEKVDMVYDIALDIFGNVFVTGTSGTIKYDNQGNLLWTAPEAGRDILVDQSGYVYVAGGGTVKYDMNGEKLWEAIGGYVVIATDNIGNVYVTGSVGEGPYITKKFDSDGNELWVKYHNVPGNMFYHVTGLVVNNSGDVYITGSSEGSETSFDYCTIKYVEMTDVKDELENKGGVSKFTLSQNYPNPFNQSSIINYSIKEEGLVELIIYNILGQKVRTLVNQREPKGAHLAVWDGKDDGGVDLPSGCYFYVLKAGNCSTSKKLILLR